MLLVLTETLPLVTVADRLGMTIEEAAAVFHVTPETLVVSEGSGALVLEGLPPIEIAGFAWQEEAPRYVLFEDILADAADAQRAMMEDNRWTA